MRADPGPEAGLKQSALTRAPCAYRCRARPRLCLRVLCGCNRRLSGALGSMARRTIIRATALLGVPTSQKFRVAVIGTNFISGSDVATCVPIGFIGECLTAFGRDQLYIVSHIGQP